MRKKLFFSTVMSVFIISAIFFCFGQAMAQEKIKLTYSNFFPPTHIQSQLAEAWCKEVEKRTEGAIEIQYYPGGTLTQANQCYDGVVEGLSDIGFSVLAYSRGRFPILGAVDLPMGYTSGIVTTRIANAVYNKFKPAEFNDTEVMYLHAHGPGLIHTKDKAVRTLDDLKGLKLRGHGTSANVIKALGATPVGLPMPDSYQSIQKGVVDGSAYPLESNKGWKLGEVTDYATAAFSSAYTTTFFVVMNKDKWKSLPKNIQNIIKEINSEWIGKHAAAWDESDFEGLRFFLEQGNEIIGIDKKESMKWQEAVAPVIDDYVKILDKQGINGKELIAFIKEELK